MTFFPRPNENDFLLKQGNSRWLHFSKPIEIFTTDKVEEVISLLQAVQDKTALGFHAAGFLSYEAAPAFDPAFSSHSPDFPLLWFGIYERPEEVCIESPAGSSATVQAKWSNHSSYPEYAQHIQKIKEYIAAGNTYQVNHTIRLSKASQLDQSWSFFQEQILPQDALFSAYWCGSQHAIASGSPELFFEKTGTKITCRPMKGTRPRGKDRAQDRALQEELFHSPKDRAENVMILDMIRNDLGMIAESGTVKADNIFATEAYKTVWQMTSSVEARSSATIVEIFRALFPCSSITGAPKVETMRIINELEAEARGIYTGCIGHISPDHDARFNVAIRTASFCQKSQTARYGTGGGIVWDSSIEEEWQECLTKTAILKKNVPDFVLFETLLYTPTSGFTLVENHLQRLQKSAAHFHFSFCHQESLQRLNSFRASGFCRVRLELSYDGTLNMHVTELGDTMPHIEQPWQLALGDSPVSSHNPFLAHKTSKREEYSQRFVAGYNDTLLYNEYGEITESTIANIVILKGGKLYTPALAAGLLAGTFRRTLLEQGKITEKRLYLDDILSAEKLWLINSVREWIPVDGDRFTQEYSSHTIPQKERK